jgi:hypothetical protein
MDNNSRKDIRRMLKVFGIRADETLVAHLARHPEVATLKIRITLEDITDYGDSEPEESISFSIEEDIHR